MFFYSETNLFKRVRHKKQHKIFSLSKTMFNMIFLARAFEKAKISVWQLRVLFVGNGHHQFAMNKKQGKEMAQAALSLSEPSKLLKRPMPDACDTSEE